MLNHEAPEWNTQVFDSGAFVLYGIRLFDSGGFVRPRRMDPSGAGFKFCALEKLFDGGRKLQRVESNGIRFIGQNIVACNTTSRPITIRFAQ